MDAPPLSRHRYLLWPAGWFLTGVGLVAGDVFSSPRSGSLWLAFVLGACGWGLAGGGSAPAAAGRRLALGLGWGALFTASLALGLHWGDLLEGTGGAGFLGLIAASALLGGVGGAVTEGLSGTGPLRSVAAFLRWAALFAGGTWLAVVALYLALSLPVLQPLVGERLALLLGGALGWSAGGAVAGLASRAAPARPTAGLSA